MACEWMDNEAALYPHPLGRATAGAGGHEAPALPTFVVRAFRGLFPRFLFPRRFENVYPCP